jgi:hypothetical protein
MDRMSRAHAVCVLVLLLSGAHTYARAEQDGPAPINTTRSISAGADDDIVARGDMENTGESAGHASGTYMGVVPGAATPPPAAVRAGKGPATITWPGFQMRADGSSRVFVQSSAQIEPELKSADGKILVHLPGARIAAETNRLPLETRFFNTPVAKVSLTVDRTGATLVMDMRAAVTPQITSERASNGYYFTFIDLPKGEYVAAPGAKPPVGPSMAPALGDEKVKAPAAGEAKAPAPEASIDADAAVSGKTSAQSTSVKASGQARAGIKLH